MVDASIRSGRPHGRVLIVTDKPGWSYDTIAKGLVRYNDNPGLVLDVAAASTELEFIQREHRAYDLVFVLGWTDVIAKSKKHAFEDRLPFLDRNKLITGIHSHRSWDGYQSQPDHTPEPPPELIARLAQLKGVNTISRRLHGIFLRAGLGKLALTENGVDTDLFCPTRAVNTDRTQSLVLGFCGSKDIAKHDALKGFGEFIEPLGSLPGVRVEVLGARGEHQVKREDMPALYNGIDLYVCASSSEGFSQSVLEAAACGRAIVSTRVGGCEDLIDEGVNGCFIRRDLAQIKDVISGLQADRARVARMGGHSRQQLVDRYAWHVRVRDWLRFVESHLPPQ